MIVMGRVPRGGGMQKKNRKFHGICGSSVIVLVVGVISSLRVPLSAERT